MTKADTPTENSKKQSENTHPTKNFDYKMIAGRLSHFVSWSDDSNPTSVVELVYGISTFPLTAKAV